MKAVLYACSAACVPAPPEKRFPVNHLTKKGTQMRNVREVVLAGICAAVIGFGTESRAAAKIDISEDCWLNVAVLGQAHCKLETDAADENDIYLRRGRIILSGQLKDGIQFFVETDNDNAGKNGAGSVSTDIQDAFVDFRLLKSDSAEAWVAGGLILLPFSFENKSSAASLLGLDYNAETIQFVNSFVWRDYGAELHGNFGRKVSYRVGAFDGYDPYATAAIRKNDAAPLRCTGHVAVNILGTAETSSFYTQERLQDAPYVSFGAGFDTQPKATVTIPLPGETAVEQDSDAWVVDVQSGFKAGPVKVTLNGAYYEWDNGVFKGATAFAEGGVKAGKVEATGKWILVDPDSGDETSDYTAGLNYFFKKHNVRAGVEYRWGDSNDMVLGGVQFLL